MSQRGKVRVSYFENDYEDNSDDSKDTVRITLPVETADLYLFLKDYSKLHCLPMFSKNNAGSGLYDLINKP